MHYLLLNRTWSKQKHSLTQTEIQSPIIYFTGIFIIGEALSWIFLSTGYELSKDFKFIYIVTMGAALTLLFITVMFAPIKKAPLIDIRDRHALRTHMWYAFGGYLASVTGSFLILSQVVLKNFGY